MLAENQDNGNRGLAIDVVVRGLGIDDWGRGMGLEDWGQRLNLSRNTFQYTTASGRL
jgi:hypothetical protein